MDTLYRPCDLSDAKDHSDEGIPYVLTSAGCWPDEKDDCGVVALAIACDITYDLSHKICEEYLGRKYGRPNQSLLNPVTVRNLPFKFKPIYRFKSWKKINGEWLFRYNPRVRLHTFQDMFPIGRYYLEISGPDNPHAMAIVDGKIHDTFWNSPNQWVRGAWKFKGFKPYFSKYLDGN